MTVARAELLPAGRGHRRRVPRRGPDRPVREHQHDRHRRLRAPQDAAARFRRRVRDRDQRATGVRHHAAVRPVVRRAHRLPHVAGNGGAEQSERIRREGLAQGASVVVTDLGIRRRRRMRLFLPGASTRSGDGWEPRIADTCDDATPTDAELSDPGAGPRGRLHEVGRRKLLGRARARREPGNEHDGRHGATLPMKNGPGPTTVAADDHESTCCPGGVHDRLTSQIGS
jgi:hypothetical protein